MSTIVDIWRLKVNIQGVSFIVSPSMDAGFLRDNAAVFMDKMRRALCTHTFVLVL